MRSIRYFFQKIPFYPFLIGLYPVLFLWQANFTQILAYVVLRSLLTSLGITLFVFILCLAVFRRLQIAAAVAGLILVLFFSYGQIFTLVNKLNIFGFLVGRHRFMLLVWGVLLVVGVFFILRAKSDLRNLTLTFNLVSIFLVGLSLLQLGYLIVKNPSVVSNIPTSHSPVKSKASTLAVKTDTPDVYYFLLDGYARQDVLNSDVHLDNQQFISNLESLGFDIPNCAQSNYTSTVTSMAATLNMNYFDALGTSDSAIATLKLNDRMGILEPLISNNLVMREFRQLGYKIVTLNGPYPFIDISNSDVIFDYQSSISPLNTIEAFKFEYIFLRTTLMRVIIEASGSAPEKYNYLPKAISEVINSKYSNYSIYLQNLYDLNAMENVTRLPGKKFVYAHLLVTHPPYTFSPGGGFLADLDSEYTMDGYVDSITYVDQRMLTIIKNILAGSKTPPVIILQGDHGDAVINQFSLQKFKILNAYYLPGEGKTKIYPTITPVNTFRLILSQYFNMDLPLLPDKSIWINPAVSSGYVFAPSSCVH